MNKLYLFKSDSLGFRVSRKNDSDYLLMLSQAAPKTYSSCPEEIEDRIKYDTNHYKEKGYTAFLVFELNSGDFIGRAGFGDIQNDEIEVGYIVLDKYRGKGYATEMLKTLLLWAKEHINKNKIFSITVIDHTASERVMQKAGLTFYKRDKVDGEDCVIYEYKF